MGLEMLLFLKYCTGEVIKNRKRNNLGEIQTLLQQRCDRFKKKWNKQEYSIFDHTCLFDLYLPHILYMSLGAILLSVNTFPTILKRSFEVVLHMFYGEAWRINCAKTALLSKIQPISCSTSALHPHSPWAGFSLLVACADTFQQGIWVNTGEQQKACKITSALHFPLYHIIFFF